MRFKVLLCDVVIECHHGALRGVCEAHHFCAVFFFRFPFELRFNDCLRTDKLNGVNETEWSPLLDVGEALTFAVHLSQSNESRWLHLKFD